MEESEKLRAFREIMNAAVMSGWLTAHNYNCTQTNKRPLSDTELDAMQTMAAQVVIFHYVNFIRDAKAQHILEKLEVDLPEDLDAYTNAIISSNRQLENVEAPQETKNTEEEETPSE